MSCIGIYSNLSESPLGTGTTVPTLDSIGGGSALALGTPFHYPPVDGLSTLATGGTGGTGSSSSSTVGLLTTGGTAELGMSHWLSDGTVKSELRSPGLDANLAATATNLPLGSTAAHLDGTGLFCANPGSTAATLDALQSQSAAASNVYDHKSDYYNYYNSMQQYTPAFYSSAYGATAYGARTASTKIPSPNTY
uniref:Uncharacterized protein n=1 Tax=Anopheles maculatus TaxID=74869 RepID=A0A182TC52_9DIPT